MVMWIVIGLAVWLTLAVLVGLVVAPTLGAIGRSLSELPDQGENPGPPRRRLRLVT